MIGEFLFVNGRSRSVICSLVWVTHQGLKHHSAQFKGDPLTDGSTGNKRSSLPTGADVRGLCVSNLIRSNVHCSCPVRLSKQPGSPQCRSVFIFIRDITIDGCTIVLRESPVKFFFMVRAMFLKATSHFRPRCKLLSDLLKSTISCELVRADGLAMEMLITMDLRVIYGSLTTFWQPRTNVVAALGDLSANLVQTPASCCRSAKTVWEYVTIGKLSRCVCTANALRPVRRGNDLGACYLGSLNNTGAN